MSCHGQWSAVASPYRVCLVLPAYEASDKSLQPWQRADRRFFWNAHLLQPLLGTHAAHTRGCRTASRALCSLVCAPLAFFGPISAAANAHEFIVPMINGMVKTLPSLTVGGKEFDLVFISRRSCFNVGTRFNVRGLDSVRGGAGAVEPVCTCV